MVLYFVQIFVVSVSAFPSSWIQRINTESNVSREADSSLNNYDVDFADLDIYFKNNLTDVKTQNYTKEIIPFSTDFSDGNSSSSERNISNTTQETRQRKSKIDPLLQNITRAFNESRNTRQETSSEEEESSEEDANMLTGLLSSFLGGLSRPDGTIDLEAILGLLGSLSTQNPDGTYDFSGLTELLRSFFGGTDGGSDVGAFAGALIGAVIKGIANPPGAKGAGILSGKLASAILPALSGPPDTDDNAMKPGKPPQLDSGSFLTGFIKTFLGSGGNGTTQGGGKQSKYTLFKLIFSAITGVFQAASSLSSKSDWQ